jgi:hypothetical protein
MGIANGWKRGARGPLRLNTPAFRQKFPKSAEKLFFDLRE